MKNLADLADMCPTMGFVLFETDPDPASISNTEPDPDQLYEFGGSGIFVNHLDVLVMGEGTDD